MKFYHSYFRGSNAAASLKHGIERWNLTKQKYDLRGSNAAASLKPEQVETDALAGDELPRQ